MKRNLLIASILVSFLILGGCAAVSEKPPTVTLADIGIIEAGLLEQRFSCKLRVMNPNDVDIPLTGLNFEVEVNGQPFARGVSNKPVTVPRLGEEILEVTAVSTLANFLRQITEWKSGENPALTYRVKGSLAAGSLGWLPFDESGKLEVPTVHEKY